MGTLLSILSVIASTVILVVDPTSMLVFYALGAIIVALLGALWLRSNPGWLGGAALLGWLAVMISTPTELSRTQFNQLRRVVRRQRDGWEQAQALLDFFEPLQAWSNALLAVMTVFFLVLLVVAIKRGPLGAHRTMLEMSDGLSHACVQVGKAASLLYLPMIVIILYDVTQRKYLGWAPDFTNSAWYQTFTSTRLQEMEWHLHAVLFLMALGFGYVRDAHVRIELVRDNLRPRTRAWIELLGVALFMIPYCYVILKYGNENALRAYHIGEGSDALTGLPNRFVIKGFLPLGFAFVALAGMASMLKNIVYLFGPASLRAEAGFYAVGEQPAPAATEA